MNIRPTLDRVVIKRGVQETVSPMGIVIPNASAEKPDQGIVVAVGPGKVVGDSVKPVDLKVGDNVIFHMHAGQQIKMGAEEFLILTEVDILAVVN